MGIAHHANYPIWFEAGRTDYFRCLGMTYSEIEDNGILLPLIEMGCCFRGPIRYEDHLLLLTRPAEFTGLKIKFEYEILLQGKSVTTGWTLHACTDHRLKPLNLAKANSRLYQLLKTAVDAARDPS